MRIGVVTSDGRTKTIKVTISRLVRHRKYGKYLGRRTVLHAHDEKNEFKVGETVWIEECPPISKQKRWTVLPRTTS